MIGKQVGNYRVEERIGAGGMGVVYLATDTKLKRQVAIKVLPDEYTRDADRLARFEREARLLAALNHPHIGAIYGLEEIGGACSLVLEYVPGQTLDERLASGPLPVKEALRVCSQIADALEASHAKGIIHRDLKSANVKVTPDGSVKVLDFGLGKTSGDGVPESGGSGPSGQGRTLTAEISQPGMIVGTAAYMSPEQARGKPVDKRTDVWAFGCVLYETLTGRKAFAGETVSDLIATILDREPAWEALPAALPANVRTLLRRCLEKDLKDRLRDLGDARLELEEALSGRAAAVAAKPALSRAFWPAVAAAFVLGGAAIALWAGRQARVRPSAEVVRFVHEMPAGQKLVPAWNPTLIFSRDGQALAFNYRLGKTQTAVERRFGDLDLKPLGESKGLIAPVYSPDGRWVVTGDTNDSMLKKFAVVGGAPVPLTGIDMYGRGDWGKDGYIYFTVRYPGAILRVPENGGAPEPVTTLDPKQEEFTHRHAQILPGGKAIMFTVVSAGMESYNDARIELQTLPGKERRVLVKGGFCGRYSPSGHIVYANAGNLYAVPFDIGKLEVTGLPVKVVEGVMMSVNTGAAYFDVSGAGSLAYVPGLAEGGERLLVWVDRQGKAEPLPLPPHSYLFPRISPDGKTLAVEIEGATHNLYAYDFGRGVMTKITTDGASHAPVWTPDGKEICYRSWKAGTMTLWEMPADLSRPGERLTMIGERQSPVSVSPDGRYLAFNQMDMPASGQMGMNADQSMGMDAAAGMKANSGFGIYVLPLQGEDRKPQPFLRSQFSQASGKFSPDGKWVAYCSDESGQPEVYVQPWPGPGPKIQLSSEGGTDPLWSHATKEIFYRNGDKMMVVPISTGGGLQPGRPRLLWEGHYSLGMSSSCGPPGVSSGNYDVTADGQRFLMVKDKDQDVSSTKIVIVLNWTEDLKRQLASRLP